MLECKYCHSTNVKVQAIEKQKGRGLFASIMWIILAICTCGAILLIPLLSRKGSKTSTVIVCQDCGKMSKV